MLENKGIKRPPIGMSDFRMVRNNNKYYVDKTMYIPQLEKISNFLFLIRPRRFGKSIFLSMIADYYDCENKELDQEFEGTWISELYNMTFPRYLDRRIILKTISTPIVADN